MKNSSNTGRDAHVESRPLFEVGHVVATPGALEALMDSQQDAMHFIRRHQGGDWGSELCADDRQANEDALKGGLRLLSVYRTAKGVRLYVITEADRSSSCVLLPCEY